MPESAITRQLREHLKTHHESLQRQRDFWTQSGPNAGERVLQTRLRAVQALSKSFDGTMTLLERELFKAPDLNETEIQEARAMRLDFEDEILELEGNLETNIQIRIEEREKREREQNPPPAPLSNAAAPAVVQPNVKLEPLKIPTFDGEDRIKWSSFWHEWNNAVHSRRNIDAAMKFRYLTGNALKGAALEVVEGLEATADGYVDAIRLLKQKYEDKRALIHDHLVKIFHQKALDCSNPAAVRRAIDVIRSHLRSLRAIERPTDKWDDVLIFFLLPKFPGFALDWEKETARREDPPSFEEFCSFLAARCLALERLPSHLARQEMSAIKVGQKAADLAPKKAVSNTTKRATTMIAGEARLCLFCSKPNHSIGSCWKFKRSTLAERKQFVQSKNLCSNCLYAHKPNACTSTFRCRTCSEAHHSLLHPESPSGSTTASEGTSTPSETALPPLYQRRNVPSCSRLQWLANKLGLPQTADRRYILGIAECPIVANKKVQLVVQSSDGRFSCELAAHVIPSIPGHYPTMGVARGEWLIPLSYSLADPEYFQPAKVDLVIGAEMFFALLKDGRELLPSGPLLQNSEFGWLVAGTAPLEKDDGVATCFIAREGVALQQELESSDEEEKLYKMVERFWRIEELDSCPPQSLSRDEELCEAHYLQNVRRQPDGRFLVRLPFKKSPELLGDSRRNAEIQFRRMERRLTREQWTAYAQVIQDHITKGHLSPVAEAEVPECNYFMPHHAVVRPDASTTRIRVVFNASAKSSSGYSLNDLLYVGRKTLPDLLPILVKSRLHPFLVGADIAKMYMQFAAHPSDAPYQMIVWRDKQDEPLRCLRFDRVVFKVSSAPYLACRSLLFLAETEGERFPLAAAAIKEATYVDNVLKACSDLESARRLVRELKEMLATAQLQLHKWFATHPDVLEEISEEQREELLEMADGSGAVKAFGLVLDKEGEYRFRFKSHSIDRTTKRTILSGLARVFDPLGLLEPVKVTMKALFQATWRLEADWDTLLPPEVTGEWEALWAEMAELEDLRVPRYALGDGTIEEVELHVFGDASFTAYGAAVYVRSVTQAGEITVRLLKAKSKVTPIQRRTVTIPRLELCAALIGAELVAALMAAIDIQITRTVYWTDSADVLWWLRKPAGQWTEVFVAHRVAKIQALSTSVQWRHIPGKLNPADLLSRGLSPAKLARSREWFNGPSFLLEEEGVWPANLEPLHVSLVATTEPESSSPSACIDQKAVDPVVACKYANTYSTLLRIGGYAARFIRECRKRASMTKAAGTPTPKRTTRLTPGRPIPSPPNPPPLLAEEILAGRNLIARLVQVYSFSAEIKALTKGEQLPRTSALVKLRPMLGADRLLRVLGRLENSALPYDARHPIILPAKHPFTSAVATHYHEEMCHTGPTNTLAAIRREYWPLRGGRLVHSIGRHCLRCFHIKPRLSTQLMGALPPTRVDVPPAPFYNSGVDYCGPFFITERVRKRPPKKVYVAIFVCLASRAIHIELAEDLSGAEFLQILDNFCNRRGKPDVLMSDNMRGFTGAAGELKRFADHLETDPVVRSGVASRRITWRTIPPTAPHQGGIWESAVRLFKWHLKRSVGEELLTWKEFFSFVVACEAVLNSRPLQPLSEDSDSLETLTPGHFLIGRAITSFPEPSLSTAKLSLLTRWERVKAIKQQFWHKWSVAYIQQYQVRNKWTEAAPNLKVGQLVLISDDNAPPLQWPLGRIIKICPDKHGVVRVVHLKTAKGPLIRDVRQLAALPSNGESGQGGGHV